MKKFKSGEFHTWTEHEIGQFENRWPIGTMQRLAFAVLLFTGQRVSDAARMDASDLGHDTIQINQIKTSAKLEIPIHPDLRAILIASGTIDRAIIRTSFAKAFTSAGLGNFVSAAIDESGLPARCVAHGLRKAAARRLAEAGCSPTPSDSQTSIQVWE